MLNKTLLAIPIFIIIVSGCTQYRAKYPADLRQLHENVWDQILDVDLDEKDLDRLLETMTGKGQWPGIDYPSKTCGSWSPRTHLGNQLNLAIAYQTKGSKYYHNPEVSEKIHLALNHWLENDFRSPNWWHPEIGTPQNDSSRSDPDGSRTNRQAEGTWIQDTRALKDGKDWTE